MPGINKDSKIALVGCGALGSFYGARLCHVGYNVCFLLRSDFEEVRKKGLQVQSVDGNFIVHPASAKEPAHIGVSDLVLIGLKTTANSCFERLLPSLVGPETLVLTLQNGLGNEEALSALLGPENILGGLCFVCTNRLAPGVIQHTAHGRILMGEFGRPAQPRTHDVARMFQHAGIQCDVTDDLAQAHWEKLVWNIPFNGLGVAGCAGYQAVVTGALTPQTVVGQCLPTDVLLQDSLWYELVIELMKEVVSAARASGYAVPDSCIEQNINRTRNMGSYRASTLIDFEKGLPLELDSLFIEPLRQAQRARIPTPRLESLVKLLTFLERKRGHLTVST